MPLAVSSSSIDAICEADGSITITATDGELPYSFEIIAGPITYPLQSSNIFEALPPGDYTVQISDGCGTMLTEMATVGGNYTIPDLTFVATDEVCPGANDGTAEGTATDGLAPYEYRLIALTNPPDTIGLQSSSLFTGLAPGDYQMQVFDQCENFQTRDVLISAAVVAPISAAIGVSGSPPVIACDQYEIRVRVSSTIPKYPFNYVLTDETTGMVVTTGSTTSPFFFGLIVPSNTHSYRIVFTDACGQTATSTITLSPSVGVRKGITCDPGTVQVVATFFGPSQTFEILSGPEMRPAQSTGLYTALTLGTYVFQVTDGCGLSRTRQVTLSGPSWGITLSQSNGSACELGKTRMSYFGNGSGSVPPFSFTLTDAPSGVPFPQTIASPQDLGDLPPGAYTFTVSDDCGVTVTSSIVLDDLLELNYQADVEYGCVTGKIILSGSFNSSQGNVRLEQLDGTVVEGFKPQPFTDFTNLFPGTYVLAFYPRTFCSGIRDTIEVPAYEQPYLDLLIGIECSNGSGVITSFPAGGIGPYTFELIAGPELRPAQPTPIFNDLPLGTYDVRIVDDCTNSFINSVSIEPFNPEINGYNPPICIGDPVSLYVDNINGATYSWTGPNGFIANTHQIDFAMATVQDIGNYEVTIDIPGCENAVVDLEMYVAGPCGILVDINMLLEGPYLSSTGLMSDNLRTSGLLPELEPYTALGYEHLVDGGGEMVDPLIFNVTGPNAIVDWVFVELKDAVDNSIGISTRSALLQADGDVVDLDGISPVLFPGVPVGSYYVAARHRNHLDIMTPGALPLNEVTAVPFTFRNGSAFGSLTYADVQKSIGPGLFALNEADYDNSGSIDAADRSIAWNFRNATGYIVQDSNFDGVCDAGERSQVWNNRNKLSQIPGDL